MSRCFICLLFLMASLSANQVLATVQPRISIIIDDLGNDIVRDNRAINLPGKITCSVLPRTYYSKLIAHRCHAQHKEVMLYQTYQIIAQ